MVGDRAQVIEHLPSKLKELNPPLFKSSIDLSRYYSKSDIQMTNKHMKTMLYITNYKEMQIKATWAVTSSW
jgi:hypothetical protein